jgi:hypothetical protein
VALAHQFAFESDLVDAEMVEVWEFPELGERFDVSGVPHTVINEGAAEIIGSAPEFHLLEKIRQILEDEE